MEYFGWYRSSTTSQTGCVKEFLTVARPDLDFPPQVQYRCDLCKKHHGFRFLSGRMATTPRQRKAVADYCAAHGIETDVDLA